VNRNCKVIFIAGNGRSGSTLLDTALGQLKGFFAGGEMCLVWHRYLDPQWLCGCGTVLAQCEVWSEVMRSAYGAEAAQECSRMVAIYLDWRWLRYSCVLGDSIAGKVLQEFRCRIGVLYEALCRVTGCRVIVDSSKSIAYGRLLQGIAGIEFYPLHLVRDPRAVCYSRQRRKLVKVAPGVPPRYLEVVSTTRAAWNWSRVVLLNELVWRYAKGSTRGAMRVRYEDFVARPAAILQTIADLAGEPAIGLQHQGRNSIRLRATHTAGGNPSRFITGDVAVRSDDEWRHKMPFRHRLLASLTCAPLAYLMDYPLFPMRSGRTPDTARWSDPVDRSAVRTVRH
jgi:hypothetical protein